MEAMLRPRLWLAACALIGGCAASGVREKAADCVPDRSALGAACIVDTYYALLAQRRYAEARRLWWDGGEASRGDEARFAAYFQYRGEAGAPGPIEGAAGSSYIEVPATVHARRKGGPAFVGRESVTLRRINDVPGTTAEQRSWRIVSIEP
jgi:hypothetical protein